MSGATEFGASAIENANEAVSRTPRVAVPFFILHWNRPEECLRVVKAFQEQEVPLDIRVIDNHSNSEALQSLNDGLPAEVPLLALEKNKGWGGAFNIELQKWLDSNGSEFCFVSAHDTVPATGCIELLLRAMTDNPRIGIACPEYGTPEVPRFSRLRYYRVEHVKPRARGTSEPVDMPYGTLIAFRKECLQEIGLFDERYFAYGDEHDLGLRARRKNWLVSIVWGAIVENPGTWTSGRTRSYLFARNSLLLVKTHAGSGWAALRLLLMLPNSVRFLRRDYPFSGSARMLGMRDFLFGRFGPPPRSGGE